MTIKPDHTPDSKNGDRWGPAPDPDGALFHSRYATLAANTIDYWMMPDDPDMTAPLVLNAIAAAPVLEDASLQIYIHVPFCAQRCRFCAFSGGNHLDFRAAEQFSKLVIWQMRDLLNRTQIRGQRIRSINIGGGSPDLLDTHVGEVLKAARDLPGCDDRTEISVEFTLSTTKRRFIEELVRYGVTKASFGIQSFDPRVRKYMRQPKTLCHYDQVLGWLDGRIPIVNADLITGMPGQDLGNVMSDLQTLMDDPRINVVSSYLLTSGAAPSLIAGLVTGDLPRPPSYREQADMRLHTYETLLRSGWVRRGTNSYFCPDRIAPDVLETVAGNECIGASHYEAVLLGAGPQAISYLPGVRAENTVDIEAWSRAAERGEHSFCLPKCSTAHQKDTAIWAFPLRWEGLPQHRFDRMTAHGALTEEQKTTFDQLVHEGLVLHGDEGYRLSILGEVFMGHLVHDLKQAPGRRAVDDYVAEGRALGEAISRGRIRDENRANNRQFALPLLERN